MGLFGGKKTYVSSVAYNLAGDELERPNFLKTAVFAGTIMENDFSIADMLQTTYLNGPGIKMRNFYRWAQDNYGLIGVPQGFRSGTVNSEDVGNTLAGVIPHDPGDSVSVSNVEIKLADYSYWADQWMMENHPDLIETDWVSDYQEDTGLIMITYEDTSIETFTPTDFDRSAMYIYARYVITKGEVSGPIIEGTIVPLGSGDPFPDVTAYTLDSEDLTPHTVSLETRTVIHSTFSDARPDEDSDNSTFADGDYDEFHRVYSKTEYQGFEDGGFFLEDRLYSDRQIQHHWQDGAVTVSTTTDTTYTDIGGGVIRTDYITIDEDVITLDKSYREDTQEITLQSWTQPAIYIYKIGTTEPTLDAALVDNGDNGGYLPFIPIRIDNKFVSETYLPDVYALAKKAYKKASQGRKFDDLIASIADNESLDDIDYSYVMYGVSLNVVDNAGRKYIYDLFHNLMENQTTNRPDFDDWFTQNEFYLDSLAAWTEWKNAQSDSGDPLYGTPEPTMLQNTASPTSEILIKANGTGIDTNLNISITWNSIEESTGTGLKKPGAKKDELWFETVPGDVERITLNWQLTEDSWQTLTVTGMVHKNFIYNGKYVEIKSTEALNDEEETGFILPLRYQTLKEMSLIDSTQLSTCCTFVVFNAYQVVKQKWYQTGIFKIFQIILVIAVSVVATPAAGAALQAAFSITTGFDGTIFSLIFGKGFGAFVTIILTKILSEVTEPIFGKKLGRAIATIGAILIVAVGTGMLGGASFDQALRSVFSLSAQNIMAMTSAVGQGIAVYTGIGTNNIIQAQQELIKNYEEESKRIAELYRQNFGFNDLGFNSILLTEASYVVIESQASFLERTLLTGSDISEMTLRAINDFSKINLNVSLPD